MTDVAKIVSDRPRFKSIELEWPVEFKGKVYTTVNLHRMTAGEVAKWSEQVAAMMKENPDGTVRFPLFRDDENNSLPDEVMDALDTDDKDRLDEEALAFLPQRFRGATG